MEGDGRRNANSLINSLVVESLGPALEAGDVGDAALLPALQKIHQFIGIQSTHEAKTRLRDESLQEMLLVSAQRHGRKIGEALEEWILSLVDQTNCRVGGSQQVADWLHARLDTLLAEGIAQTKETRQSREQLLASLNASPRPAGTAASSKGTSITSELRQYTHLLLQEVTFEAVSKCLSVIESFASRSSDRLRDLWKDLNRLADEFGSTHPNGGMDAPENRLERAPSKPDSFTSAVVGDMTDERSGDDIERSFFREQSLTLRGLFDAE